MSTDPFALSTLKMWLTEGGGSFHPDVQFKYTENAGNVAIAAKDLPADTTIVSCPFSLAVTEELAQRNLSKLLSTEGITAWSERQWISVYICLHWILADSKPPELAHYPYINTLPSSHKLRTPLHFTESELEAFKVSNVYHATIDRKRELKEEWQQCQFDLNAKNDALGSGLTWERYLTATTYISSRAFSSSLLSSNPTLKTTTSTKPVLLPGIDSLNHKRGQPVSWSVTYPTESESTLATSAIKEPTVSLVLHNKTLADEEIFNNYGPKPNAELILGYGFSLPDNPDDTILLKIGGLENRWEIGRSAQGAEALWDEILQFMTSSDEEEREAYEAQLDAADMLSDMVQTLLRKLPSETGPEDGSLRPEVATMLWDYIQGQKAILFSLLDFCQRKEEEAIDLARSLGVELVIED